MRPLTMLDADGTIYDLVGGLITRLRNQFAYTLHREDVKKYTLAGLTGRPEIDQYIIDGCLRDAKFYFGLQPFPGVQEGILRLSEVSRLAVITARNPYYLRATQLAVARDFPGVPITCACRPQGKVRAAKDLGVKYAIEDNGNTALELAQANIKTFLVQTSYTFLPKRHRLIRVVSSFSEAVDQILNPNSEKVEVA
ncbi:MAG TPA: hypothetical protein VEI97_10230 [bacterium]|nr:hypothetical protein [bacterium]